jgi:hypothetical protein
MNETVTDKRREDERGEEKRAVTLETIFHKMRPAVGPILEGRVRNN